MARRDYSRQPPAPRVRVNNRIRVREVRAVDADGKQIGVIPTSEALKLAQQRGLDLVEVAPNSVPPVCRIMDYGKYRYEQSKKERLARKHNVATKVKEISFHPRIDEHDYEVKLRRAIGFLERGWKVKASLFFRRREMARQDLGREVIQRFVKDLEPYGATESPPRQSGRMVHAVIGPKPGVRPKAAGKKDEDEGDRKAGNA